MQVTRGHLAGVLATLWPHARLPDSFMTSADEVVQLIRDSRGIADSELPSVFIAVPGIQVDGRDFIRQALEENVELVLAEADDDTAEATSDPRIVTLAELGRTLGELGRLLFAVPDSLELIGVTGTNGKSSVTHYIAALCEALGRPAGMVGTLGWGRAGQLIDSGQTTPGPLELQAALAGMAGAGVERIAMECSSHALEQRRLAGCYIKVGVFTNLSRDHLDYHGSMAAYAASKAKLFKRPELKLAVVNGDDALARLMLAGVASDVRVLASGTQASTTLRVLDWQPHAAGQRALIATPKGEQVLELALMGRFNLDNALLAIATLYGMGESLERLFQAASQLVPVPGRMQVLTHAGAPTVVIDYAHTPDALHNALQALRAHLPAAENVVSGRLWCIFGCGGDRDAGKRPLMAQAAEALADRLVITDDNPRGEVASEIRDQVLNGLSASGREHAWNVAGRDTAIARAVAQAGADDVILIAGKGHETYQEIQGQRMPFSDQEYAEAALILRESIS